MGTQPLTTEQQLLAEENHNLIYSFAQYKNLSLEEYYDILAIGLCQAARAYDETKGKFSTLAYNCMYHAYCLECNRNNRQCIIPNDKLLYYESDLCNSSCNDFYDSDNHASYVDYELKNHYSDYDKVMDEMLLSNLIGLLNEKEKSVYEYMMDGLTQKKIAEKMGWSPQNVSLQLQKIRGKWRRYLERNKIGLFG